MLARNILTEDFRALRRDLGSIAADVNLLAQRQDRLDRNIAAIMRHMGINPDE